MKKIIVLTTVLVLTLLACQKEIKYKGEENESRLVINAVVEVDSTFRISVERTTFFLAEDEPKKRLILQGATVTVTNQSSGQVYTLTKANTDSSYVFPFVTQAKTTYHIRVEHPDYEIVESEVETTSKVDILAMDTTYVNTEDGQLLQTDLTWFDDGSVENYYLVRVRTESNDTLYGYTQFMELRSNDPDAISNKETDIDGYVQYDNSLFINDKNFNGQQKKLRFRFYDFQGVDSIGNPVPLKKHIILASMSKATYLYYTSLAAYSKTDEFSEPVKVFTNITNGFGIFGSIAYAYKDL